MILQATFFGPRWVALELTADMNGYAVWDAAGSPVDQVNVMLTINAGVTVGSLSPGTPAIDATGSWAPGSRLTIVNAGNVYGAGGSGGAGGASTNGAGAQGSSGGDAIRLGLPTSIDNGNGYIFGGGGGGGGGGGANDGLGASAGGGGGGGGRGSGTSSGGAAGGDTGGTLPQPGGSGSAGGAGSGGNGGSHQVVSGEEVFFAIGGGGGSGGDWGQAGSTGQAGVRVNSGGPGGAGGAGGAGGYAVRVQGYELTWWAGNTAERVKGTVG